MMASGDQAFKNRFFAINKLLIRGFKMMKYVIGIDGGGTKTLVACASLDGTVLELRKTGTVNPYICGIKQTKSLIADAIEAILTKLGATVDDVDNVFIGLAGADSDSDIEELTAAFDTTILKELSYEIQTDIWIAFKSMCIESVGAVSICGTGHNTAVLAADNKKITIKSYRYPLGNFGGGKMIADMAMNAAYRSYENTGDKTALEDELCKFCGYESMLSLARAVINSNYTLQYDFSLPKLVIGLASNGDDVSKNILKTIGHEQGRMTGGLIEKAGLCEAELPIVLAGMVYSADSSGNLISSYEESVRKYCPYAKPLLIDREPVQGALSSAIEKSRGGMSRSDFIQTAGIINETMIGLMRLEKDGT